MGNNLLFGPYPKSQTTSSTAVDITFQVPQAGVIRLLQLRAMLAGTYSGTFKYTLVKEDTNYNQTFETGVNADNVYAELNLYCQSGDNIQIQTSATAPNGTHYFELVFGNDGQR